MVLLFKSSHHEQFMVRMTITIKVTIYNHTLILVTYNHHHQNLQFTKVIYLSTWSISDPPNTVDVELERYKDTQNMRERLLI